MNVTVQELDQLLVDYVAKEAEKEELEAQVKAKNKELMPMLAKITAYLKELGREEYDTPLAKAKISQKWRVRNPESQEEKEIFFEFLRERGIFNALASVNSNSLNALYMRDWEEAKGRGEGMTFSMPGIGAPTLFETVTIKPKKK